VFINIIGNAVATIFVARWENALDRGKLVAELKAGYRPPDDPERNSAKVRLYSAS
jgi:aerobic C4-dicarboxylate transport protein